jgi:LysM repeat protein
MPRHGSSHAPNVRRLFASGLFVCLVFALGIGSSLASPTALQATCTGRWYRIQQGDSWSSLAQRTGITVAALKANNPRLAQQPQGWLLVGQQLCIPGGSPGSTTAVSNTPTPTVDDTLWVTVRRGDSWAVLAARLGVSMAALQAANQQAMRPNQVLRPGDRIRVPVTPEMTLKIPCPATLEGFPLSAARVLTEFNSSPALLRSYLERCGALTKDWGTVAPASLRDGTAPEVVIVAADPTAGTAGPLGVLAVLGPGELGWEVLYQTGVAADVVLLAAEDINADGHPDVIWSDTTCGASACFTTVHVRSWIDGRFQEWIDGSTTMSSATVKLADVLPEGSGQEIVMAGGVIGTALAGPQQVVTNTWASPAGATYALVDQQAAPSDCLYHRIQNADIALATGQQDGYAAAIAAYRDAIDSPRFVACWIRENEVDELRAYALYRLAVAQAYAGDGQAAEQAVADLAQRYPADSYATLAELWWLAYRTTRDASAACAVAATVAARHPDTWQRLADYGFANPTYSADMVCPGNL